MKLVGHRGAASIAPENTLKSIRAAIRAGVDAVEFDVRVTADGELAVIHDPSLQWVAGKDLKVRDMKLKSLQAQVTLSGEKIPSLQEALAACGQTPAIIEAKDSDWAEVLAAELDTWKWLENARVISFNYDELAKFHQLMPQVKVWALTNNKAGEALHLVRTMGFDGIDFSFWLLNPLTYILARRRKLEVAVYTVNNLWIAWYMKFMFPKVWLTTDKPQKMQHLRAFPHRLQKS